MNGMLTNGAIGSVRVEVQKERRGWDNVGIVKDSERLVGE